jgi:hypothetical protein
MEHFGAGRFHSGPQAGGENEYYKRWIGLAGRQRLAFLD